MSSDFENSSTSKVEMFGLQNLKLSESSTIFKGQLSEIEFQLDLFSENKDPETVTTEPQVMDLAASESTGPDSSTELTLNSDLSSNNETTDHQESESISVSSVLVDDFLLQELSAIPDRFGFKIGDVADLLGIKQYVLRYWEQEFDLLKPKKASNNQRLYTRKDVENAFLIRKLLYRDKFSIEGARQALKDVKFEVKKAKEKAREKAKETEKEVREIEKEKTKLMDQLMDQALLKKTHDLHHKLDHVQDNLKLFIGDIQKTKALFASV